MGNWINWNLIRKVFGMTSVADTSRELPSPPKKKMGLFTAMLVVAKLPVLVAVFTITAVAVLYGIGHCFITVAGIIQGYFGLLPAALYVFSPVWIPLASLFTRGWLRKAALVRVGRDPW